jgi:hypothetical protein
MTLNQNEFKWLPQNKLILTDIPQVERASFHLVAILGSDQPFFDQLYCGSGI